MKTSDVSAAPPPPATTGKTKKRPPRDPSAPSTKRPVKKALPPPRTGSLPLYPPPAAPAPVAPAPPPPSPPPEAPAPVVPEVFDGMPESVDDETFLHFTNILGEDHPSQEMQSQEYNDAKMQDQEMQEEEEGFVDPTPRRAVRGANFTVKEDELLCRAWQTITLDAITGVEQQSNTYWECIHDHYKDNNKGGLYRSRVSLSHSWQTIQVDCQKWASCLAQVDRLNPSGTNADDKVHIAQELYKGNQRRKVKGKASHLVCTIVVQHDEKWRNRGANEIPNKKKSNSSVGETVHIDIDEDNSSGEDERSPTPSVARKRPDARKKEKDKLKKGVDNVYKESLDNILNIRKEVAAQKKDLKTKELEEKVAAEQRRVAAEERRNEIEERRAQIDARRAVAEERRALIEERKVASNDMMKRLEHEERIMFMYTSNLDVKARAYHELRDQILASRTMGGFMGGMGGNGGGSGAI